MQPDIDLSSLALSIRQWGLELGFSDVRIADVDLSHAEGELQTWLQEGCHGEMEYMASHGMKRARPAELVPGTVRVITARMDYLPRQTGGEWRRNEHIRAEEASAARVSLYARGRDYHRVMRSRLQQLASRIEQASGPFGYRVFTDSAPVMEVALAEKAGLGWRGKHTLLVSREAGSLFFVGEILVDLPLPVDEPEQPHCGRCQACIDACPTGAITSPYRVDARRCISYLTIEMKGSIPVDMRHQIGNRIYGCDDCQLVCPWNKFAQAASVMDFDVRNELDDALLVALFSWSEDEFNRRFEGSAIRRIGFERWSRNIAVALGNALKTVADKASIIHALQARAGDSSPLVREHVRWALEQADR